MPYINWNEEGKPFEVFVVSLLKMSPNRKFLLVTRRYTLFHSNSTWIQIYFKLPIIVNIKKNCNDRSLNFCLLSLKMEFDRTRNITNFDMYL